MSKNIQADVNEIVQHLTTQIAQLSSDNAVLKSLVTQYQQEMKKLENKIVEENENAE